MISFVTKKDLPKNKKLTLDFQDCDNSRQAILYVSQKLKGSESPNLVGGYSFDALFDVVSDFFMENWLSWKDIHIYNWVIFSKKHPILSQRILTLIIEAYIESIAGELRMVAWGESEFSHEELLQATTDKAPNIYIVLD